MGYLTGKRFESRDENAAGTKTGVIVSEIFRAAVEFDNKGRPLDYISCVAILWDDGSMEGAIDIETLKIVEEDKCYVVCATWPQDEDGEIIMEAYTKNSSLEEARKRASHPGIAGKNPRIGKVVFPELNQ